MHLRFGGPSCVFETIPHNFGGVLRKDETMGHGKKKRFVLIPILLLVAVLAACGGKGGESGDTTRTGGGTEQTTQASASFDWKNFTILCNEYATDAIRKSTVTLQKSISAQFGIRLETDTDFVRKGAEVPNDRYEILVGETNRQASIDVLAELRNDRKCHSMDYIIRVTENKVVILGGSDEATLAAVEYLTGGALTSLAAGYDYHFRRNNGVIVLNGKNMENYSVVMPEGAPDSLTEAVEELRVKINNITGYKPPIVKKATGSDIVIKYGTEQYGPVGAVYFKGANLVIDGGHPLSCETVLRSFAETLRGGLSLKADYTLTEEADLVTYFKGTSDKDALSYTCGEDMKFTLSLLCEGRVISCPQFRWEITADDGQSARSGMVSGKNGTLTLSASVSKPGFVRLIVTPCDENGRAISGMETFDGGAGADVMKLEQGLPEPEDFDAFWEKQIGLLNQVKPEVISMVKVDAGTPGYEAYDVKIKCVGPTPVSGILTMPVGAKAGSLKAQMTFNGYGYAGVTPVCAPNTLYFNVNAHGIDNLREDAYYKEFERTHLKYGWNEEENKNPETCYFLYMDLRNIQGARWLLTRPEYDGKGLYLRGGSQGAMQCVAVAAFVRETVDLELFIPWMADLGGKEAGRIKGWVPEANPDVTGILYFDTANLAKRVTCPVRISGYLGDYTCPPSTLVVLYKSFSSQKSLILYQNGTHGRYPKDTYSYQLK